MTTTVSSYMFRTLLRCSHHHIDNNMIHASVCKAESARCLMRLYYWQWSMEQRQPQSIQWSSIGIFCFNVCEGRVIKLPPGESQHSKANWVDSCSRALLMHWIAWNHSRKRWLPRVSVDLVTAHWSSVWQVNQHVLISSLIAMQMEICLRLECVHVRMNGLGYHLCLCMNTS
jgi:hypothetical protein